VAQNQLQVSKMHSKPQSKTRQEKSATRKSDSDETPLKSKTPAQARGHTSEFSDRLRHLRTKHNFSLDELAQKTGLTKGFLSLVERGLKAPSISTLLSLSKVYAVSVGTLLDEQSPADPPYSLVRSSEGRKYAKEGSLYGYRYEAIAFHKAKKRMEPFLVSPPLRLPRKVFRHEGDEMVFVLKGQVRIHLGDDQISLLPGDCFYFDASVPHRSHSIGKERALTLVVVTANR
jgi:transcriptional regulator with XRE-family HTH domain